MVRLLTLPAVVAVLALLLGSGRADAGVINGWSTFGNVSVGDGQAWLQTRSGLSASRLAAGLGVDLGDLNINHASALSQTLTIGESDVLSFSWNFFTDELTGPGSGRDDIAFWGLFDADTGAAVLPGVTVLANAFQSSALSASDSAFGRETGLSPVLESLSAGNYLLVFGVANVGNNRNHSALLIDNISLASGGSVVDPLVQQTIVNPEPASIAMWGLGMVGVAVGAFRRRRRETSLQPA